MLFVEASSANDSTTLSYVEICDLLLIFGI
jgi:hypothetical protein